MSTSSTPPPWNKLPRWTLAALAAPVVLLVGMFYLWPVITLVVETVSTDALRRAVQDSALRHVLWFTTWQAIVSTALTICVGFVPAWLLARYDFAGRRLVTTLVTVPFVLPTVVVGAAFLALLPDSLDQSVTAILLAHVFLNVAVVVRGVGGLLEQLPADLTAAARTLGASPMRAMREITLPLVAPAVYASASVVFLFTFTSFGVVRLLGGPANPTLEVEIWQRATRLGDIGIAAILSIAQLVVVGLVVMWFSRLQTQRLLALGLRPLRQRRRIPRGRERVVVVATVAAITLVACLPLIALIEQSLRTGSGHSLAAWRAVFGGESPATDRPTSAPVDAVGSMITSLRYSVVATMLSVVIGGLAALAIVTWGRAGRLLDVGVMLPLGTSAVTIGFGLLITFDHAPVDWRAEPWMVPLGHALVAIPIMVRILLPALRAIDPRLRSAASTLGASPLRAWREVDLRLIGAPLLGCAGLAMAISLGEFGATSFLTRQGQATMPIVIQQLLARPGAALHAQGYVVATVLAAMTVVAIGGFELARRRASDA